MPFGAAPRGRPPLGIGERAGTGTRPYGVPLAVERDRILFSDLC